MPGRGPQTFKKRQKEQQRKEKQEEKLAKRLKRKEAQASSPTADQENDSSFTSQGVETDASESNADTH